MQRLLNPLGPKGPRGRVTPANIDRLILDNLRQVVGKLASSKSEEETFHLQDLALRLTTMVELAGFEEKKKALEDIQGEIPEGCGCS